jgi:hypothetical protein
MGAGYHVWAQSIKVGNIALVCGVFLCARLGNVGIAGKNFALICVRYAFII